MEYTQDDCIRDTKEHISQVREFMMIVANHLIQRALVHDKSKIESPELEIFTEYTPKLKNSTYGSDEYKEFLIGMGSGLQHHYKHNSHHPEHHKSGINGMNMLDMIEMFCDWKAAVMRHADGDIFKSIEINQKRFKYSHDIKRLFINTELSFHNYAIEWGITDNREGYYVANTIEELHAKVDEDKTTTEQEKKDLKYGFFREFENCEYETKNVCWDNCFDVYWYKNN